MIDALVAASRESRTATDLQSGAVIALGYNEIDRLARDRCLVGVGLTVFDFLGIEGPLREWYSELMFTNEGDAHARLRRLVSRAFTPRSVEQLREYTKALVASGFEEVEEEGGGDLVVTFARLGTRMICRLLGVPDDDVLVFAGWADALSRVFGFMDAAQIDEAASGLADLLAYTSELVARRDGDEGDDLITALLRAEHDDDKLSRHEVVTMVANLLVAAHDTTASQLGCCLLSLLRHPEQVSAIRSGDATSGEAITETMRYEPAIPLFPRTVREPVEIGGVERPTGTMVFLAVGSGNRDPEVYSDPDRFDVGRFRAPELPRPLSFGTGPHFCLGSNLARMALDETCRGFTEWDIRPTLDPDRVTWKMVLGRSPASLPVQVARVC